ncbi:fibronectin-binding a domain protein [Leptolyngbya sp. Heron Island J]|uniref:Rqc2 family fibronectin-binding protein n=1 Tax=Leptolyngbya sp. Heron Island J TaxID=1385935 RepID=UPI0003B9E017|nr:NFACT RNA binding domain-containing protein [Leptolyngbya sp. Heron Island J]ESA32029.1 fibronectin-binding a domain protein [Leptolyngbya sp. Heron Island J]
MQPVDITTFRAVCHELTAEWLPARCEQVVQQDRNTICLALRTFDRRGWLTISWHPQAARIHIGAAPPKRPDTFTFSQQLKHQFSGLALTKISFLAPWERAVDLQFARRPDESAEWHLYVEIMGRYSNVLLTNAQQEIVTAAHQVNEQQSSVRTIRTGGQYRPPPAIVGTLPRLDEPFVDWQERISLVPGKLSKMMVKSYSGLSTALAKQLIDVAGLDSNQITDSLTGDDWQQLYVQWQRWLQCLEKNDFQPAYTANGYAVLGWAGEPATGSIQQLLNNYYTSHLNQQIFSQLHHQLIQKTKTLTGKLRQKAANFYRRLDDSDQAEHYRIQADLLMAYLHEWRPGMSSIQLQDFESGQPVTLALNPEKNAVQNAQALYKRHQKLKRTRDAVMPLLEQVETELHYLEQVESALSQTAEYTNADDLMALEEIRDELVQQGYLDDPYQRQDKQRSRDRLPNFYRFQTPSGTEVWVGRNNNQNEALSFRAANDYDLWLHTQEIPGSHVLLRLEPGAKASDDDLAFAANMAAWFSRARQSEQVPVVYTKPKHVYKPKGARPGMVIYKHEQVLWGQPQQAKAYLAAVGDQ